MKPSLVLFTAITLLLPVGLASHSTAYDSIYKTFSRSTRQGESQRGMGNGLSVLPGGWHDGEVVKRQARQGRVPAISRSTSEPTGDAIPHPQPNCVCDLRNTGGVAGFGSDHGWSASKASIRSLAHASLGLGSAEFYLAYKDNDVAGMKDAALAMGIDLAAAAIPFIPGGAGIALKAGKWFISPKQLQRKFRHAEAFGITGNYSLANAKKFYTKIQEHLNSPKTKMMLGTYRGNPAKLCVNKKSKLVVILKPNGDFVSGWELDPKQLKYVLAFGRLW